MEEDSDHQSGARIASSDDLLTEILIRLPLASIFRTKSVCKHWRLLLTRRHFTHRYDNLLKSPGLFDHTHVAPLKPIKPIYIPFDVESRSTPPFASLDICLNRSNVRMVQSCNGLLLCCTCHNGGSEYHVFNPTTMQLAFIPSLPKNLCSMALAFHPTHCVHYKVVCVCVLKAAEGLLQIQVYSSDTRSWKICVEYFSAHYLNFRDPVYWNGAVHWAPGYLDNNFLYYKLDVEQLQTLPVPKELVSNIEISMYFGESRGHLHLIPHYVQNICKEDILHLNVYEMLMDHSGWFVKYRLHFDELLGDFPDMIYQNLDRNYFGNSIPLYLCGFKVVDVVRGKEEEETFLVLETALKMVRYNVHDKSLKELYNYEEYSFDFEIVHRYIEALSSF